MMKGPKIFKAFMGCGVWLCELVCVFKCKLKKKNKVT